MFCREQVAQLRDEVALLDERGADLAVVGNGTPEQAAELAAELSLVFPLLTDPQRRSFVALETRRNLRGVFHPGTLRSVWRAWRGGHRQRGVQGDPMQLGGVVAIRPGGAVVFVQRSAFAGDHPAMKTVAAAL